MAEKSPSNNDMYGEQSDEEEVKVTEQEPVKPAPLPKAKLPDVSQSVHNDILSHFILLVLFLH